MLEKARETSRFAKGILREPLPDDEHTFASDPKGKRRAPAPSSHFPREATHRAEELHDLGSGLFQARGARGTRGLSKRCHPDAVPIRGFRSSDAVPPPVPRDKTGSLSFAIPSVPASRSPFEPERSRRSNRDRRRPHRARVTSPRRDHAGLGSRERREDMVGKEGGKLKPLKQAKKGAKEYDEVRGSTFFFRGVKRGTVGNEPSWGSGRAAPFASSDKRRAGFGREEEKI